MKTRPVQPSAPRFVIMKIRLKTALKVKLCFFTLLEENLLYSPMMSDAPVPWGHLEIETQRFPAGTERLRLLRGADYLCLVQHGQVEISCPGHELTLKPGEVLFVPAGVPSDQRVKENLTWRVMRVRPGAWSSHAIPDREARTFLRSLALAIQEAGPRLPLSEECLQKLGRRLKRMQRIWGRPEQPLYHARLKAECLGLYIDFANDAPLQEFLEKGSEENLSRQNALRKVSPALERLHNRNWLTETDLSVQELAEACGYNASRFHALFVEATGSTPNRYLTERRIALACQWLLDREDSILEVAFASGFNTQSRFYSAFKDITGLSPAAWRKQNRQTP